MPTKISYIMLTLLIPTLLLSNISQGVLALPVAAGSALSDTAGHHSIRSLILNTYAHWKRGEKDDQSIMFDLGDPANKVFLYVLVALLVLLVMYCLHGCCSCCKCAFTSNPIVFLLCCGWKNRKRIAEAAHQMTEHSERPRQSSRNENSSVSKSTYDKEGAP